MATDILLDSDGDLIWQDGDLVIGDSSEQNIENILAAQKGEFRQSPLVGVGILNYLSSSMTFITRRKLEREISMQLAADGAAEVEASFSKEGKLQVTAVYPA